MLVYIEGVDFAGKSTLVASLKTLFPSALFLHEPGGTQIGEEIAPLTYMYADPVTKLFLFSAARRELCQKVLIPNADKLIFLDRFVYSTFAYQGGGDGVNLKTVVTLSAYATAGVKPALGIYLRIPIETMEERRIATGLRNPLDEKDHDFYKRTIDIYDMLAQVDGDFSIIDATRSKEEILADVLTMLKVRGVTPETQTTDAARESLLPEG